MPNIERTILVPLGDKNRPDLEMAACWEAREIAGAIQDEEANQGKLVSVDTFSLQRLPCCNPFFYYQKGNGITAMGGYLVKVRQLDFPKKK